MNYQPWIFGFMVIQFVINCSTGIYVWWTNKQKVNNARFEEHSQRILKLEASRSPCENHGRMEANDVKLFERLDALHGDIRELAGVIKSLKGAVTMINDHLINARKQ